MSKNFGRPFSSSDEPQTLVTPKRRRHLIDHIAFWGTLACVLVWAPSLMVGAVAISLAAGWPLLLIVGGAMLVAWLVLE